MHRPPWSWSPFVISISISISISIYPIYPSICLSVCLSIYLSIYLSVYLSIYLICLSIHFSSIFTHDYHVISIHISLYQYYTLNPYKSQIMETIQDPRKPPYFHGAFDHTFPAFLTTPLRLGQRRSPTCRCPCPEIGYRWWRPWRMQDPPPRCRA